MTSAASKPSCPAKRSRSVSVSLSSRPSTAPDKIRRLYQPGGSLDSQTSDTQWEQTLLGDEESQKDDLGSDSDIEIIHDHFNEQESQQPQFNEPESQLELIQERKIAEATSVLQRHRHLPRHLPADKPVVLAAIPLSINNDFVLRKVQDLVDHCLQNMMQDLTSVTARRDAVLAELAREKELILREREWIRVLEQSLSEHGIAFPRYPGPQTA